MPTLHVDLNDGESGIQAPASLGMLPGEILPQVAPGRKRKKISPDEVRALSTRNANSDRQALLGAEALCGKWPRRRSMETLFC